MTVDAEEPLALVAFRLGHGRTLDLEPAPRDREWIDADPGGSARRCLPLMVANQAGWILRSRHRLTARWDGGDGKESLAVTYHAGPYPYPASSHFGHGILTWKLPVLFRTPPGYNLLIRGPANWPKDGASALDGLVETDWTPASFTVNWKLTRPGLAVSFEPGEPVAMVVPQPRGDLERFAPAIRHIETEPQLARATRAWAARRRHRLREVDLPTWNVKRPIWQLDYLRGEQPDGTRFRDHQRKLRLRPFVEVDRSTR